MTNQTQVILKCNKKNTLFFFNGLMEIHSVNIIYFFYTQQKIWLIVIKTETPVHHKYTKGARASKRQT